MTFVNHYQAKWFLADLTFVSDILANGIWGSKCYEIFGILGIKAGHVQTAIAALELIRIGVLLYQRAIERETQGVVSSALHDEKNRAQD